MKLTKRDIERFANEIMQYLIDRDMHNMVTIYYNGKSMKTAGTTQDTEIIINENDDPHKHFEYAAYDHILSMSFDGELYDSLNYTSAHIDGFDAIFARYGCYYELGNSWNLTACLCDDETEVEYTVYERPKEEITIYHNCAFAPRELERIMDAWYDKSAAYGDAGSCVLLAGFRFDYQGDSYFMMACSPWQGSLSWESGIDYVRGLLEAVGAENIRYDYGRMD